MRGTAQIDRDAPIIKTTAAVLAFGIPPRIESYPCIRCGACIRVCPMRLNPAMLARYIAAENYAMAAKLQLDRCHGCGCCSWACPSKINLVQHIKLGAYQCSQRHISGNEPGPVPDFTVDAFSPPEPADPIEQDPPK
jgi:electron transport complex protein RnfC